MSLITTYQDLFPSSTIMRQRANNGTITIPGSADARLIAPNSQGCQFYFSDMSAPVLYERLSTMWQSAHPAQPLFLETKLSVFTGTTNLRIAGLAIFTTPFLSGALVPFYSYQMGWYKNDSKLHVYLDTPTAEAEAVTAVTTADPASTANLFRIYWNPYNRPMWISEIGVALQTDYLCFAYSINNGTTWTSMGTRLRDFDFSQAYAGLFVRKWETSAVNAQADFAYFKTLEYSADDMKLMAPDSHGRNQDLLALEDAGTVRNEGGPARFDFLGANDSVTSDFRENRLSLEDSYQFPDVAGLQSRFDLSIVKADSELPKDIVGLEEGLFLQPDQTDFIKGKYDADGKELLGDVAPRHALYYDATADAWHTHGAGFYGAGRNGKLYYDGVECGPGSFGTVADGLRRAAWGASDGYLDSYGIAQCAPTVPTNDKLRFTLVAQQFGAVKSTLRWFLTGDFDIQMDFAVVLTGAGPTSGGIRLQACIDWNNEIYVGRELWGTLGYAKNVCNNGSWVSFSSTASSDTTGKLRLTRVGAAVSAYYWSGGAWVQLGSSYSMSNVKPMWVWAGIWGNANTTSTAEVSAFTINSGATTNLIGWAREAAGTYRGSLAEFPQHALISASGAALDIIDVDTNKLWMSFRQATNNVLHAFSSTTPYTRSVVMKDGMLLVAYRSADGAAVEGGLLWIDFNLDWIRIGRDAGSTVTGGHYNVELSTSIWARDYSNGGIISRNAGRTFFGDYGNWALQTNRVLWVDLLYTGGYQHRLIATSAGITMQKWQRWKLEGTNAAHIDTPYYAVGTQVGTMYWCCYQPSNMDLLYHNRVNLFVTHYATWAAVIDGGGGTWVENHSYTLAGTIDPYARTAEAQDMIAVSGTYAYYARKEGVYRMDLTTGTNVLLFGKIGSGATHEVLPDYAKVSSVQVAVDGAVSLLLVGLSYPDRPVAVRLDTNILYWKGFMDDGHQPFAMAVGA